MSDVEEEEDTVVYVYDRRKGDNPEKKIHLGGVFGFKAFEETVRSKLDLKKQEKFVICTTNRVHIKDDETYEDLVEGNETLYILNDINQELSAAAEQRVEYLPHYDTLVKSGMYEYYASEGHNPLPFAFAELIDNSLAATVDIDGDRNVEIQLIFDDIVGHSIVVLDSGRGMTPRQLNDWAIYRLSKFSRSKTTNGNAPVPAAKVPKSLNSDISYFGVGGKQAIFFIGDAVRMITRVNKSNDVHELCLSKDEFERREQKRAAIYEGHIRNRRAGDHSHLPGAGSEHIRQLIANEPNLAHFTAVVITGVALEHVTYLRRDFQQWCRQLAHIYHYYLHGPNGNLEKKSAARRSSSPVFQPISMHVVVYEKGKVVKRQQLHEVDDDLQTRYIRSASNAFDFVAHVDGVGQVEGCLRYHPFLYDHETYPQEEEFHVPGPASEEDAEQIGFEVQPMNNRRPIFECYWNGRLIPYTTIDYLDWCQYKRSGSSLPQECYHRFSGVLWTDSHFQVSTNKLTFMDLANKLKDKTTVFAKVTNSGQEHRGSIFRAFQDWLKETHEVHDKQVKFLHQKEQIRRPGISQKRLQSPWCVYQAIEWDGKLFEKGQLVRTQRTIPIVCGHVKHFLLFGDHTGDVYATGGDVEIVQEPTSLYSETKIFPLSKLDRMATTTNIQLQIQEEELRLPQRLMIDWPEGDQLFNNAKLSAGGLIGPMQVEILNGKGEAIHKLPGERSKHLLVEQRVVCHGPHGDKDLIKLVSQHGGKKWPYWFGKCENFTMLGPHSLQLQVILNDAVPGLPVGSLPSTRIKFMVIEAPPSKFSLGLLEGPFHVGQPFQIPLDLQDKFNNSSRPTGNIKPQVSAGDMEITHDGTTVSGHSLVIKNVRMVGTVNSSAGKNVQLKVTLPGLEHSTEVMKIRLLPGPPKQLVHQQDDGSEFELENGASLELAVCVLDAAGNTAVHNNMDVTCKLSGASHLPSMSGTASGGLVKLASPPINVPLFGKPVVLKGQVDMPRHKSVPGLQFTVTMKPSSRPAKLEVFLVDGKDGKRRKLTTDEDVNCEAGSTLSGLQFQLLDEAGRVVELDNAVTGRIRVNWVPRVSREQVKQGNLPDVKVPSTAGESKFCQVSLAGSHELDVSFTVEPNPGSMAKLMCTCTQTELSVGKSTAEVIRVTAVDQYGNTLQELPDSVLKEVKVSGRKVKQPVKTALDGYTILISDVSFDTTTVGTEEVEVRLGDAIGHIRFELVAARPAEVKFVDCKHTEEAFTVYNDSRLPMPLIVQLYDKYGNPAREANVRIVLGKTQGLKLSPPVHQQKTNTQGQVNFGHVTVQAARGNYIITPRATYGRDQIFGRNLRICVEPDATKAVRVKVVTPTTAVRCAARAVLPEFDVFVEAEDGSVLTTTSSAHMRLNISEQAVGNGAPLFTQEPSHRKDGDENGHFYFRELKAPSKVGTVHAMFHYQDGSTDISSKALSIEVRPGQPVKLVPDRMPPTPAVSNAASGSQRQLVRNLQLHLQDEFGNRTVDGSLSGTVNATLVHSPGGSGPLPCLAGGQQSVSLSLVAGSATVHQLLLLENCPGQNEQQYIVRFTVTCPSLPAGGASIPPFDLSFLFCNDSQKQQQLAQWSQQRDKLSETVSAYRRVFSTAEQLVAELRGVMQEHQTSEKRLRQELHQLGVPASGLRTVDTVDQLMRECLIHREEMQNQPRRQCMLQPAYKDPDIVGKIGHLAYVHDDDIARVLSWHMASDMDCVVTVTTVKAKEVYRQSNGLQQVLPLDSIYRRTLPDPNKPLPHCRGGNRSYRPPGNPVYARSLLKFQANEEACQIVFGMLLGETIILDSLDDANAYRMEVVKVTHCPTLLTRTGDRIRSNGKFGGIQNRAPSLDRLRGIVFGQPLMPEFDLLCRKMDKLKEIRQALLKFTQAKEELTMQEKRLNSPDLLKQRQECLQKEAELRQLEQRIGLSPSATTASVARRGAGANATPGRPLSTRNRRPVESPPAKRRRT